jgi:hypothetical protein
MDYTPRTHLHKLTMSFPSPYAREVSSAPDCKRFTGQDFNFKPAPIVRFLMLALKYWPKLDKNWPSYLDKVTLTNAWCLSLWPLTNNLAIKSFEDLRYLR